MYFEFEKQNDDPNRAKWRYVMMGAISLLLLLLLSWRSVIPSIEKDLTERVTATLIENKINNVLISTSGRDITLGGLVSENDYQTIIELTKDIRGANKIQYDFELRGNSPSKTPKSGDDS